MTEYIAGNLSNNKPKDRCTFYQFFTNARNGEHEYCSVKCTYNFECKCSLYQKDKEIKER